MVINIANVGLFLNARGNLAPNILGGGVGRTVVSRTLYYESRYRYRGGYARIFSNRILEGYRVSDPSELVMYTQGERLSPSITELTMLLV